MVIKSELTISRESITNTILGNYLLDLYQKELHKDSKNPIKLMELKEIWAKTFLNETDPHFITKRDNLISQLNPEFLAHESVVIGYGLIKNILPLIFSDNKIIITDKNVRPIISSSFGEDIFNQSKVFFIEDINGNELTRIIDEINNGNTELLIGIGGGRVMDYLKYIQMKTKKFSLAIPTSLATHVYASPKIHALPAIKELGAKKTIDGPVPDLAILDINFLEKLQNNHPRLIRAGLGDIMAFITAVEDWKIAEKHGHYPVNSIVTEMCADIINRISQINVNEPLSQWIKEYVSIQVLLCNITDWVGSPPASGSEHLFAKEAEEGLEDVPLHGELVALGTLIMRRVQDKECTSVYNLMNKLGLPTSLQEIGISKEKVVAAMQRCKDYGQKKDRFTIVNVIDLNLDCSEKIIDYLLNNKFIE